MEVPTKPWYLSQTIWLNVVALLIEIVGTILDSAGLLQLPPQWQTYLGVVVAVLNIIKRWLTTQPLGPAGSTRTITPKKAA